MARYNASRAVIVPPRNTDPENIILYKFLLRGSKVKRKLERTRTSLSDIEDETVKRSNSGFSETEDEDETCVPISLEHLLTEMESGDFLYPMNVDRNVHVLDFAGCHLAKGFFGQRGGEVFPSFDKEIYRRIEFFLTGVSQYAAGEELMTFVSFPYLGFLKEFRRSGQHKESLSLIEYMILGDSDAPIIEDYEDMIVVHQAWANLDSIAVFRSADDVSVQPPFSFGLELADVFHVLVHTLSSIIEYPEAEVLTQIRRRISKEEVAVWEFLSNSSLTISEHGNNPSSKISERNDNRIWDLSKRVAQLSIFLSAMISVVNAQIQTIQQFEELIGRTTRKRDSNQRDTEQRAGRKRNPAFTSNPIQAAPDVLESLEEVLFEREDMRQRLDNMLKSVKGLQQLVFQIIGTETARQQALLVQQQAKETQMQVKLAQGQAEETRIQVQLSKSAQEQGKSVLVFTIITTVFLPLSFFTSYFGMNTTDIRGTDMTQRTFWTYCGPISAFVVLVALLVAFRRKLLKRKSDEELAEAEALQKQD